METSTMEQDTNLSGTSKYDGDLNDGTRDEHNTHPLELSTTKNYTKMDAYNLDPEIFSRIISYSISRNGTVSKTRLLSSTIRQIEKT